MRYYIDIDELTSKYFRLLHSITNPTNTMEYCNAIIYDELERFVNDNKDVLIKEGILIEV